MNVDFHQDRHARDQTIPELAEPGTVEQNFDGDALDNLSEVSSCIVRWQQGELSAAGRGDTLHRSRERLAGESIELDPDGLPRPEMRQLSFFEVGGYPHLGLHQGQQGLAGLHVVAGFEVLLADASGGRRDDLSVRKLQLRLFQAGAGDLFLRPRGGSGRSGRLQSGPGSKQGSFGAVRLGPSEVQFLFRNGAGTALEQGTRAIEILAGLGGASPFARHLSAGLRNTGLRFLDLGGRLSDLGQSLPAANLELRAVESSQHGTRCDSLVFVNQDLLYIAANSRTNRVDMAGQVRIVGAYPGPAVRQVTQTEVRDGAQRHAEE